MITLLGLLVSTLEEIYIYIYMRTRPVIIYIYIYISVCVCKQTVMEDKTKTKKPMHACTVTFLVKHMVIDD